MVHNSPSIMGIELLQDHAYRARRGQWSIEELPWDEPLNYCGETQREQTICKLDSLTIAESMFLFELGIRQQIGENMRHLLQVPAPLLSCVRWHDIDTLRHLWTLRQLRQLLHETGAMVKERKREVSRVLPPSRLRMLNTHMLQVDTRAMDLLIRAAAAQYLYESIGKRSMIPHLRATYASCAQDSERHVDYLTAWLKHRLHSRGKTVIKSLQVSATAQTAKITSSLRPSLHAFAGASNSNDSEVAVGLFAAISSSLLKLGPDWRGYPARLIHNAPRSPWLIWVLR